MVSEASKRARRNVRRGKAWENQVAEDLAGRSSRGSGSDITDYYGRRAEVKRRKIAPRWFWKIYEECLADAYDGFCITKFAVFIPYKDGLGYMARQEWKFPRILVLMPVVRAAPKWLSEWLEQATADVDRERPGDIPRVAIHIDQRKPGTGSLEVWMLPFEQFGEYAKGEK